jgi:hypothetical protein
MRNRAANGSRRSVDGAWRTLARAQLAVLPLSFALLATAAWAQGPALEPELGESGIPLGGFLVHPRLTFENYYDDNVFAAENGEVGDYIASIIPRLGAETTWSRHYLALTGAGRFNRYGRLTNEENDEYAIDAEGRLDLTGTSTLGATFGLGRRTVGRADSENSRRLEPQQLDYYDADLGYRHGFAQLHLDLQGFLNRLDYLQPEDDDRDRYQFGGSARLLHRFSPALSLFLEPGVEFRDYDQKVDNTGVQRSTVTAGALFGAEFEITSVIDGEISLGPVHVAFDEPTFDDLTTLAVRGETTWAITRLTRLEVELRRLVSPTTRRGASSKVQSLASLSVRHELLRNLYLRAEASFFREKFKQLGRIDDNYRVRAGAEYVVNRFFSVVAEYTYRARNSNFPGRSFRKNLVSLTFDTGF